MGSPGAQRRLLAIAARLVPPSRGGSGNGRRSRISGRMALSPLSKLTMARPASSPEPSRPRAVDEQQIEPRRAAGVSCTGRALPLPPSRRVPDDVQHRRHRRHRIPLTTCTWSSLGRLVSMFTRCASHDAEAKQVFSINAEGMAPALATIEWYEEHDNGSCRAATGCWPRPPRAWRKEKLVTTWEGETDRRRHPAEGAPGGRVLRLVPQVNRRLPPTLARGPSRRRTFWTGRRRSSAAPRRRSCFRTRWWVRSGLTIASHLDNIGRIRVPRRLRG